MISEHSAHLNPLPFGIRTWLWRYTCLLLLISMLWHRQAIFESKGDKLSSSAESKIRTHQSLRHQIASRLNARWQTDWAIEDQAKNLNLTARRYDQRAFSPLDPTAVWHTYIHFYSGICTGTGNIFIGDFRMSMLRWFWESTPKWLSFKMRLSFWLQLAYWYDQMRNKDWHFRVAWPGIELSTCRVTGRFHKNSI